jgi:hypothetical protein
MVANLEELELLMNLHQPIQKNPAHFAGHGAALKERSRGLSVQSSCAIWCTVLQESKHKKK